MDDGENDEDGVDADSKKAELETLLANADDDFKYAAQKLKKDPKCAHYISMQESSKATAEEIRAQLRELKGPDDQLQYKGNRLRKLIENEKNGSLHCGRLTKKKGKQGTEPMLCVKNT